MKAVGKLAGHADETMILRRYQHVVGDMERDAAKAVPNLNLEKNGSDNQSKTTDEDKSR